MVSMTGPAIIIRHQTMTAADRKAAKRAERQRQAEIEAKIRAGDEKRRAEAVTAQELAACERDLYGAVTRGLRQLVAGYDGAMEPRSPTELTALLREPLASDETLATTPPDEVSWIDLNRLVERDPDQAHAVYAGIKDAARTELMAGMRAARTVEGRPGTPYQRAQFGAILDQFRLSYAPQHAAEELLVQQMAVCYEKYLRWQTIESERVEQEEWAAQRDRRRLWENMSLRERDRYEQEHGYMPPRVSDIEAIEQATMNAERYLRSFRGLLRTFQQMRSRLGTVMFAGDATLNIAERQMVVAARSTN
jgi:hypothetical protein